MNIISNRTFERLLFFVIALLAMSRGVSAWDGSGTQTDPYLIQNIGDWHPVSNVSDEDKKAVIPPFRAFLLPSAHNAKAYISMTMEDEMTGIDTIETIDEDGTRRYYDLNGRELPGKPGKGVYIHNGKKYLNK